MTLTTVLCIAGQCLQGLSNSSIGSSLSAPGHSSIRLLPALYPQNTGPQLLHQLLNDPAASLLPSPGFESPTTTTSSLAFPLNVALQPGVAFYPDPFYAGKPFFSPLPSSPSSPSTLQPLPSILSSGSLFLAPNTYLTLSSTGGSNTGDLLTLWDAVPDLAQLPLSAPLSALSAASAACPAPCTRNGICSPTTGTCICPAGTTGPLCEACAPGFFGPTCAPCPSRCAQCDDGLAGSGRCLLPSSPPDAPEACHCVNGRCAPPGSTGPRCVCNAGWVDSPNGTACASCAPGFFLTDSGDCRVCGQGCQQCQDSTGRCLTCRATFSPDTATGGTRCVAPASLTANGAICPAGSFGSPSATGSSSSGSGSGVPGCAPCSPSCTTCTGPGTGDCVLCGAGTAAFPADDGRCAALGPGGECEGSQGTLVADNVKRKCDACGAKCATCTIPNFSAVSIVEQAMCTACVPGYVLAQGACVRACPPGTFIRDAADSNTGSGSNNKNNNNSGSATPVCEPCDAACARCAGAPGFCLACAGGAGLFASNGTCVASCPSGTVANSNGNGNSNNNNNNNNGSATCTPCHPDCAACSGPAFDQCTACAAPSALPLQGTGAPTPPPRPVLAGGRCLPTCGKGHFFDRTAPSSGSGSSGTSGGACRACDPVCAACMGAGPARCLACASGSHVLRAGECVPANCSSDAQPNSNGSGNGTVIPALGICLASLFAGPPTSPSNDTTSQTVSNSGSGLPWWQVLLMALGCAFLILVVVLVVLRVWRRRARRQRAMRTKAFAHAKALNGVEGRWKRIRQWVRERVGRGGGGGRVRLGKEGSASKVQQDAARELLELARLRLEEGDSSSVLSAQAEEGARRRERLREMAQLLGLHELVGAGGLHPTATRGSGHGHAEPTTLSDDAHSHAHSRLSSVSLYSQLTGEARRTPEPREPVQRETVVLGRTRTLGVGTGTGAAVRRKSPPPLVDVLIESETETDSGREGGRDGEGQRQKQRQTEAGRYAAEQRWTMGLRKGVEREREEKEREAKRKEMPFIDLLE